MGANFLGQVEVPLDPLTSGETLEDWFPLQMRRQGEEVRGEILLSLTFTSADEEASSSSRANSQALLSSASAGDADDLKVNDMGLIEVEDPNDVLAELPYEFDNPELKGELMQEKNAVVPGGIEYKAASLVKLIELLSSADIPAGSTIVDDVLCTYPTFTTGFRLLNLLLKRYVGPPESWTTNPPSPIAAQQVATFNATRKDVQNRVGSFLARWMTSSNDFSDSAQLFSYFKKLVDMNFFDPTPSLAKYFGKKFEECKKKRLGLDVAPGIPGVQLSGDKFGSIRGKVRRNRRGKELKKDNLKKRQKKKKKKKSGSGTMRADTAVRQVPLLDLNTDEIAEQITLIEHQVFVLFCFVCFFLKKKKKKSCFVQSSPLNC